MGFIHTKAEVEFLLILAANLYVLQYYWYLLILILWFLICTAEMAEPRVSKNLSICQWGTNFYRIYQSQWVLWFFKSVLTFMFFNSTLLMSAELFNSWMNLVIGNGRHNEGKCDCCRLHQSWLKLPWSLFLSSTSHSFWLPSISQSWRLVLLPLSLLVWPL